MAASTAANGKFLTSSKLLCPARVIRRGSSAGRSKLMSSSSFGCPATSGHIPDREQRLERLIQRLPLRLQRTICWLRRPSARWLRIPGGVFLILGAFLSILPLFGIWVLPVGLMLLAEDFAPLRRARDWALDWIERYRPHWFTCGEIENSTTALTPNSPVAGGTRSSGSDN
jgi:hypothetical protein